MTNDKTREDFESWARPLGYKLDWIDAESPFEAGYNNSPAYHAWHSYQAATQQSAARIAALEAKYDKLLKRHQQAAQERESLRHQVVLLKQRIAALSATDGLAPMRSMEAKKIIRQFAAMPDAPVTELVRMVERHHKITMEKQDA